MDELKENRPPAQKRLSASGKVSAIAGLTVSMVLACGGPSGENSGVLAPRGVGSSDGSTRVGPGGTGAPQDSNSNGAATGTGAGTGDQNPSSSSGQDQGGNGIVDMQTPGGGDDGLNGKPLPTVSPTATVVATQPGAPPSIETFAQLVKGKVTKIVDANALGDAGAYTEGPVYHPAGYLLFTEHKKKRIHKWVEATGQLSAFRDVGKKANGLTFDSAGDLLLCHDDGGSGLRNVSRFTTGGALSVVADAYMGARFHGPNDCVAHPNGSIFFTDPWYGDFQASEDAIYGVYQIKPDKSVVRHAELKKAPNGLAFSPDASKLYVTNSDDAPDFSAKAGKVFVFDVNSSGTLSNQRVFAENLQTPDGLKVDFEGRVYVGVRGGVKVFKPDGAEFGTIALPDTSKAASNVAFGGADFKTLFITGSEAVHKVQLAVPGAHRWMFATQLPGTMNQ